MSDIFTRYISGKDAIPYEKYFAYAGIIVASKVDSNKPWIGIEIKRGDDGRYTIRNVIPGSPAEKAGLDLDDVVIAFDDRAVGPGGPAEAVGAHKPGDVVHMLVMRLERIQELSLTIGSNPYPTYTLKPVDHPTPQQKAIYDSWLGIKAKS